MGFASSASSHRIASSSETSDSAPPRRSRRLWRLDLSVPVTSDAGARWEVRLSSFNYTRHFWIEPNDIRRNRERSVPSSIFSWP